jgi:MarR family transcriptional regulator, organic hydroperoxide resistance regulator
MDPVLEFIRVMWSVDHELQRISKRMVGRLGLTAPQRLALRFVGMQPRVTLSALAGLLHLHPGTVTGIVKHLEREGFVERQRSTEDTRRVHLRLTAAGMRLNRRRAGTVEAAVRRAFARSSAGDTATAARVMRVVAGELAGE